MVDATGRQDTAAPHPPAFGQRSRGRPFFGKTRVSKLHDPGLEIFPQFDLAKRQQCSGGALIAFEVDGGVDAGIELMNSVKLCSLAENLGSAETLITHPASMTHAAVPFEQRVTAGITDGLVRLSVGLENPQDIIADLDAALAIGKSKEVGSK